MPQAVNTDKEQWMMLYLDHLEEQSGAPYWVYQFTEAVQREEKDFYGNFRHLKDLEQHIWADFFTRTQKVLQQDPQYQLFDAREKLLSFYFTLLEVLGTKRKACQLMLDKGFWPLLSGDILKTFRQSYLKFIDILVEEAIGERLILDRVPLTDYYKHGLWLQCKFVLQYWKADHSENFVHTDAAVERAVNLSFEIMGQNAVDSLLGMGKFLYQTWWSKE